MTRSGRTTTENFFFQISDIERLDRGRFNITRVVYIGEADATNGTTKPFNSRIGLEWEPVLEVPARSGHSGNDLESSGSEDVGRGFRENGTFGRSLKKGKTVRRKHYEYVNGTYQKIYDDEEPAVKSSTTGIDNGTGEIREPVLKATTPKFRYVEDRWYPDAGLTPPAMTATESWKHWEEVSQKRGKNLDLGQEENTESVLRSFTVQLLPTRLAQLLEQAEKYAKLAFAPFRFSESESRSRRFSFHLPSLLSWAMFRSDESNRTETTTFSYGFTETEINIDDYVSTPNIVTNDTDSYLENNTTTNPIDRS